MYNHGLGSSFGGCYSPKDYTVKDPTSNNHYTNNLKYGSGSNQGGYCSPRFYILNGKKVYF